MTFEDRMERLNALMRGEQEGYVPRKLDKLPAGNKKQRRLESPPARKFKIDAALKDVYSERPLGAVFRDAAMELKGYEASIPIKKAAPETWRCRYPVHRGSSGFWDSDDWGLGEHEVRFTEGTSKVEVWDGEKMVCAIPVAALQSVLLNELLDGALPESEMPF